MKKMISMFRTRYFVTLILMFTAVNMMAQKHDDITGLMQISKQYSYVAEKDELMKQVTDLDASIKTINALKEKYAAEIAQTPNDSLATNLKEAEKNVLGIKFYIESRWPLDQITEKVKDYLGDAMRDGRNGKIMKEDPDYKWSGTWLDTKNHIRDARIALEVLRLARGESDTAFINNVARIKKCEADLEVLKAETRLLIPAKKPIAALPEIYKGADKETLRAKVKTLFNSECVKYSIHRVYLVSEGWDRVSGVRWDDMSKSYKKYDRSSLEIDVICVKKGVVNPTEGFLVSYTLEKDNISGKMYDTVLCDYLEDKPIQLSKVK